MTERSPKPRRAAGTRGISTTLLAIALAAASAAVSCAAPGPDDGDRATDAPYQGTVKEATVEEGTVETAIIDMLDGQAVRQPILRRPDGTILRLAFDSPSTVTAGTRVRITGYPERSGQLRVQTVEVQRSSAVGIGDVAVLRSAVSSMTPVKRKTAVIMSNFQNDTFQPHTQDAMRSMIFTGAASTSGYLKEFSYGLVELTGKLRTDGDVYGWFTIPFNNGPTCDWEAWVNSARQLATTAGFNATGYDNIIYYWVGTSACNFSGIAWSSVDSVINGYGGDVGAHEVMHNLGIGHSDSFACTNASGTPVPLVSTSDTSCTQVGYGDHLCTQGYLFAYQPHINSFHKARAGWLSPTNMVTLDQSGTRTLVAQESPSNLIQSLRIPRDGDTWFHVERRQPIGFDADLPSQVTSGVLVRVVPDYPFADASVLVDMQPGTADVSDAALQVGQTFSEPGRGVSIRLDSVNGSGATVSVTVPPADTNDGTGIQAQYFANMTLGGTPAVVRTDPAIVFNWLENAPAAGLPVDGFSVRWSGQIKPRFSQTYTFSTFSDDGVRLWVNGQQLINNWTDHGPTWDTGTIVLTAGIRYDIVMEYYENGGGALAKLFWASPSQPREIIPRTRLYPPTGGGPTTLLNDGFESNFNFWTDGGATNWDRATGQTHGGSFAARCGSSDTHLTSDNLNTSGRQSFTVSFWYRDSGVDDDDNVFLQFYNGSTYVNRFELGNSAENVWNQYTVTVNAATEPTFFRNNFRIRIAGDSIDSGELLWIDDVLITAQ